MPGFDKEAAGRSTDPFIETLGISYYTWYIRYNSDFLTNPMECRHDRIR